MEPLGPADVTDGALSLHARPVGEVRIVRRLGKVHEPENGRVHRDITLILFAEAKWSLALKLISVFGAGRYDLRQARSIAGVLVRSHNRAVRSDLRHKESYFRPKIRSRFEAFVWSDFMALQLSQMVGLNTGTGYLCRLASPLPAAGPLIVIVTNEDLPREGLKLLDFGAKAPDERSLCMIATEAQTAGHLPTLHKVGMTLPISEDIAGAWTELPLVDVRIGGDSCSGCLTLREEQQQRQPSASMKSRSLDQRPLIRDINRRVRYPIPAVRKRAGSRHARRNTRA